MRLARMIVLGSVVVLAAGCGGSATQKSARELSRPLDCTRLEGTTLRATECAYPKRVRSISGAKRTVPHRVIPKVPCKVRLEATFYAANDWLSLASALAKHASPCAEYYISVPPVQGREGTWTVPHAGEANLIRRYGPNFHAMAEIRVWAWADWVKKHKRSWYEAGQVARERMVTAGYSFKLGDAWAVNEFPVTMPISKTQQQAMTEFVRGLYDGGSHEPNRKGLVWRVVPFQDATDLETERSQAEAWLKQDSFWRGMSRYVRWWSSEVFAFPSASCAGTLNERTANVTHYLNSIVLLAETGGSDAAAARDFLRRSYVPLENAAWQWTFGFGVTTMPAAEMGSFVSLQAYATALFAQKHPELQTPVRVGFAWAPKNTRKLPKKQFARGNERILDRLGSALRNSFTPSGIHPARACGRDGRGCLCSFPAAQLNSGWLTFPRWSKEG